jgi:signal transduction histidine kinase/ActR/RegA family two-component response regulator
MYRIFARSKDFIPTYGRFLEDIVPHDRERVSSAIRDSVANKTGSSVEYQIILANGDLRTISCVWEVHLDEEGSAYEMFGTCQDTTEARHAQVESVARQKLEGIGTLAGGIAHDFNNLLAGVLFQADVALGECAAGSYPEEELKSIQDAAIRGSEIVRQLMIYAGKESAVEELVDLSRIAEEMLALLKVSVSKQVLLEVNLGKGLPLVSADAAQIRQVVMNLVTNASDSIGNRNGVIRVTTRYLEVGGSPSVQLEVSDTGCGMLPELQTRIFDPFFTTKSAGHGMGLAIVQGIVRGLGGTIHLTSEPDKGTTVQITLSCADTAAAGTATASHAPNQSALPYRDVNILVVEDEGLLRQSVVKMLRKIGFEVFEAADGSSAIDLLRANRGRISVILLDSTIPGAAPVDVIAEAADGRPDVSVILTSAYSQDTVAAAIDASQIRGFIRKPFQLANLLQTLQDALSGPDNRQSRAVASDP